MLSSPARSRGGDGCRKADEEPTLEFMSQEPSADEEGLHSSTHISTTTSRVISEYSSRSKCVTAALQTYLLGIAHNTGDSYIHCTVRNLQDNELCGSIRHTNTAVVASNREERERERRRLDTTS